MGVGYRGRTVGLFVGWRGIKPPALDALQELEMHNLENNGPIHRGWKMQAEVV